MYKYELMKLLDDDDVRRKIFTIVNETNDEPEEIHDAPPVVEVGKQIPDEPQIDYSEKISALEDEIRNLKEKLRATFDEKNAAIQRADNAERQLDTLRGENFRFRNSLAQTQQQVKKFQTEAFAWQDACEDERRRSKTLQREFDAAQEKISRLQGIVDKLEDELQTRFARGWELFQNYRRIGDHARQLLRGVFPRDDFTSFICGGAQTNSLETLWDVLRECIMNGRQQDADILWEVFEYCLELVNASKAQAGYSVLPVNVGDRFDSDIHSEGPGSRAQGKISNVCLPGYQNDYNGRVIRKSVVQVS